MNAEKINLNDYIQSGEGFNGASYDSKSDPNIMVKLYSENYPVEPIYAELEVAQKVYSIGVPSPEPGTIVTDGKRIGIRFRRIIGKRSFSRMLADEPERVEAYSRLFAKNCKKLHSIECPDGMFPNAKEQFLHFVDTNQNFNDSEKKVISDFIKSVPDSKTALHGDMHIGNIICTLPKGAPIDSKFDTYFIDLGYFSYGFPLFDLGMFQNICYASSPEFVLNDMHITQEFARELWKYFIDEYFFADDKLGEKYFGKGCTYESVDKALQKYTAVKIMFIGFNMGGKLPDNFETYVRKAFNL